jgi:RNA polymerase subunit RPABC4/transcription elongation factor Spt4
LEEVLARVLQLFIALTGAYALALWFALIVWTYRDITSRTTNAVTQVFSTLVVVLFFVPGAIIYLILRPRETLDDAFQRTMEEEYLLQDLDDFPVCPSCRRSVRDEFLFCPHCRTELRMPCIACHRLVDVRWDNCPYCSAEQYEQDEPAETGHEREVHASDAARHARPGIFQSIDGGRARGHRVTTEEALDDARGEQHEPGQPPFGPGKNVTESDTDSGDQDIAETKPAFRPTKARVVRDQG